MAIHLVRALGALVLASTAVLGGTAVAVAVPSAAPAAPPSGPLGTPPRPLSGAATVGTSFISSDCARTVLRYGSRGQCVVQLQLTLNVLYGERLAFDGSYGPSTTAAVYRVQARYGLTYDGICGPQTWATLLWALERARSGLPY